MLSKKIGIIKTGLFLKEIFNETGLICSLLLILLLFYIIIDNVETYYTYKFNTNISKQYNQVPVDMYHDYNTKLGVLELKLKNSITKIYDDYKIRRLTPLECFRLMGFSDTDFINAQKTISDSQLYKQAGNSIVVNVLEAIFKNLFLEEETPVIQKLF